MKLFLGIIAFALFSCTNTENKTGYIKEQNTPVRVDTVIVHDCTELKAKYDSLMRRNAYLQNAGDSLLRLTITYGFVGKSIQRYLRLTGKRPSLQKYEGGWIARALRIEEK